MITLKIDHRDSWEAGVDLKSAKELIDMLVLAEKGKEAERAEVEKNHKQDVPSVNIPDGE